MGNSEPFFAEIQANCGAILCRKFSKLRHFGRTNGEFTIPLPCGYVAENGSERALVTMSALSSLAYPATAPAMPRRTRRRLRARHQPRIRLTHAHYVPRYVPRSTYPLRTKVCTKINTTMYQALHQMYRHEYLMSCSHHEVLMCSCPQVLMSWPPYVPRYVPRSTMCIAHSAFEHTSTSAADHITRTF